MASEALVTFTKDEIEYYHQESKLKYELDMQSRIVHAKRQGERRIIELLKSGKSPEEILKEYEGK
ncbi:MAG: DUF433 domain-containing protein [Treponema sp.]|nr:DUF433 domain-containing protein [Treponema sp.]